jgi:hypothetical protein
MTKRRSHWELRLISRFYVRGLTKEQADLTYDRIQERIKRVIREELAGLDVIAGPYFMFRFARKSINADITDEEMEDGARAAAEAVERALDEAKGKGNDNKA